MYSILCGTYVFSGFSIFASYVCKVCEVNLQTKFTRFIKFARFAVCSGKQKCIFFFLGGGLFFPRIYPRTKTVDNIKLLFLLFFEEKLNFNQYLSHRPYVSSLHKLVSVTVFTHNCSACGKALWKMFIKIVFTRFFNLFTQLVFKYPFTLLKVFVTISRSSK